MADQKMKGRRRRRPLMILVFMFHVLSATGVHGRPSTVVYPVFGNVYPNGHYFVRFLIGNPPKLYELHIDTGSSLTWVQCQFRYLSIGHTMPPDKLYRPVENNFLPCTSPIRFDLIRQQQVNNKCFLRLGYADQTFVQVVMVSDYSSVLLVNGTFHIPRLAFGCAYEIGSYSPNPLPVHEGCLGLSKGKEGILIQLSSMGLTRNVIGHCFKGQGGGFLFLGDDLVPVNEMIWAPMAYCCSNHRYYFAGPAELLYGAYPTGISNLCVLFDSGTTLTYLSFEAYLEVLNRIRNDLTRTQQLQTVEGDGSSICWNRKDRKPIKAVQDVSDYFNTFSLKFPGLVQLHLRPEDYLIATEQGSICLGIQFDSKHGRNIIGAISMQDKLIVYDNEKKRIGWGSADCTFKEEWLTDHKSISIL